MKTLKAFNMVEIMIVVCLLATTVILCLPIIFSNTREAKIISSWKRLYTELATNFEVYNVSDYYSIRGLCESSSENLEKDIFKIISPYLNVDFDKNSNNLNHYHYKFKNGSQVSKHSLLYTKNYAYQSNGNIVAFKWITCECDEQTPCAIILFDMNGVDKPNRIGKDIFGMYLYKGRIEAFGSNLDSDKLENECNTNSNGMSCSEYYLRGGKF